MQITSINNNFLTFGTKKQFKRSFKTCAYCGGDFTLHNTRTIDHIKAKINGGTNDIANKIVVCARCNRDKSGDSMRAYMLRRPYVEENLRQSVIDHAEQVYDEVVWADVVKDTLKEEIGRDIFA